MHGAKVTQVITADILQIGQLSEEAQESLHKQMKAYLDRYLKKFSRISKNTSSGTLMNADLIYCLLASMEPLTTNLIPVPTSKHYGFKNTCCNSYHSYPDLDRTESGGSEVRTYNSVLLIYYLYLLCLTNTVIMQNKCYFTH
jgi:hypothetical protein